MKRVSEVTTGTISKMRFDTAGDSPAFYWYAHEGQIQRVLGKSPKQRGHRLDAMGDLVNTATAAGGGKLHVNTTGRPGGRWGYHLEHKYINVFESGSKTYETEQEAREAAQTVIEGLAHQAEEWSNMGSQDHDIPARHVVSEAT